MVRKKFDDKFHTKITGENVQPQEAFLGYFLGPFGAQACNAIFTNYLNRYFSDVLDWTNEEEFGAFSAILPALSLIMVFCGSVFAGRMMDKNRSSQGKARPYFLTAIPLIVISILLLFSTPLRAPAPVQMVWIGLAYNFYYAVAYPVYYTAHSSLVSLSTRNKEQRGRLSVLSNASAVAASGAIASIIVPLFLQSFLFVTEDGAVQRMRSYHRWRTVAIVLCLITACAILLEFFFTRERVTEENIANGTAEKRRSMSTRDQIGTCIRSRYWWMIISYFFLYQMGSAVRNGSMGYFSRWMFSSVTDEVSAGQTMGMLGLVGGLPTAVGMIAAWPIARRIGKRRAIMLGMLISAAGGFAALTNVHSFYAVCAGIVIMAVGMIPAMYVSMALLSDVLDHMEVKNGYRSDGITMAIYGAIMVCMTGVGNALINFLLMNGGYDAGLALQTSKVHRILAFCYIGLEIIGHILIFALMFFMDVEKYAKEDSAILESRRRQSPDEDSGMS